MKRIMTLVAGLVISMGSQAATNSTVKVMQYNLHNAIFSCSPTSCLCPDKNLNCSTAFKVIDLMNTNKYDLIMTEENSTDTQVPINLMKDLGHKLDQKQYALCDTIRDASLFYNVTKWTVDHTDTFEMTKNIHPDGSRFATACVLKPKNPATDPWLIAVTSHWCVGWGTSTCQYEVVDSHNRDVNTFKVKMEELRSQYPNAIVIFGGDLNSMGDEYKGLVAAMKSDTLADKTKSPNYVYPTANPYQPNSSVILQPTWPGGPVPDYIFYNPISWNQSTKVSSFTSMIDPAYLGLSDHLGPVVATFTIEIP